jgi:hypothetical protein
MKTRKGVSEIVASMIVLVIVSVFGVMLYNISAGMIAGKQNDLFSELKFESEKAQERFEVVGVDYPGEREIRIWVLNFSKNSDSEITISSVYVDDLNAEIQEAGPIILDQSNLKYITITIPADRESLVNVNNYQLLIVSEKGVRYTYAGRY